MDLRTRLAIALAPLLGLLVIIAITTPIVEQQVGARIMEASAASEDLVDGLAIEIGVLLQHDEVRALADGLPEASRARFDRYRGETAALLEAEVEREDPSQVVEAEITRRYSALAAQHDLILAALDRGDRAAAQELLRAPDYRRNLTVINSLIEEALAANSANYQRITEDNRLGVQRGFRNILLISAAGILTALALATIFIQQVARPLNLLTADAERYADGEHRGELSAVANISQIRRLRDAFQRLIDSNAARQARLEASLAAQQGQIEREASLLATVQALSLPAIPLNATTLLLPLVGHLDAARAQSLTSGMLQAIQQRRARTVILDVSGLAALDAAGVAALTSAAHAARLLGSRTILVGVRADQARALGELDAPGFSVARDIPAALGAAI